MWKQWDFILGGSKITADGDCSHEIKRHLLLGRKAMTSLDSILKSRHYSTNKGLSSQSYVFPIVMYGCESWTIREVEQQKTDVLNCAVNPKGNQSWIFIGRTDAEAEAPIPWPPDVKIWLIGKDWCWERLQAGEGDDRGWDGWMASLTRWTWVWASSKSWWWTGRPGVLLFIGSQRVGYEWATELNWTEK